VNIHALQFTVFRVEDDGTATNGAMLGISCNDEQHVGLFQRNQVEKVRALRWIKRALIRIKFGDELGYFGLIR